MSIRPTTCAAVAGVLIAAAAIGVTAQETTPPKSLYDRLGGVYPIAAVVDDLIERVYVNATLNANPAVNKARQDVRKAGLKVQLTNQVCAATGGPCKYTGMDMKTAHKDFHITEKEWEALVADFKASLAKFKVPAAEQKELLDIVSSTKADIVAGAPAAK